MSIEIAYLCSKNGYECSRGILSSLIALLVIVFSIYCVYTMYKTIKKITFEIIPICTTFLQAII